MEKSRSGLRSSEEMFPLVESYRSGEMNRTDFCEAHGLSLSTFNYWQSKYLNSIEQPLPSGFIPMEVAGVPGSFALEVQLNNGTRLYFSSYPPVSYLKELGS
ncbi:MAG: hypothetical protein AAGA10_03695 [Bacteroidota bacterium]